MFELSIALKYLIPRRKQLSVSLIALMSVVVISVVVWLVLIFLSVTEGIEKHWLSKLTALNAPVRITPTEQYYSSYYYLSDSYSAASHFTPKNIAQKATSLLSDPYSPEEDAGLPPRFPTPDRDAQGKLKDPVKQIYSILEAMQLSFQDFEISGALMRLQMLRENKTAPGQESTQSFLTQVSYLASIPSRSPSFAAMQLGPNEKDLNHLLYLSTHTTENAREDAPTLAFGAPSEKVHKRLFQLLESVHIQELESSSPFWQLPRELLAENTPFEAHAVYQADQLLRLTLPHQKKQATHSDSGTVWRVKDALYFQEQGKQKVLLPPSLPLFVEKSLKFKLEDMRFSKDVTALKDIHMRIKTSLQNVPLSGTIPFQHVYVTKAAFPKEAAWWSVNEEKETGVLLAKNYRDSGVMIGDRGYLSYHSATVSSLQEQRLPIFVAGFYDPGILSVGNRCILVPPFVTQTINATSSTFNLNRLDSNGILVWCDPIADAEKFKSLLLEKLEQAGLSSYWKVSTYKEYDFAKDLLQQFQSDKYLFSLVAAIILLVACCNIISLLTLLVNDKKKEIGILQAMGASTKSIALIFGVCGAAMGIVSGLLGAGAAVLTLKHIDAIVQLLSFIQGHDAFNAAFFGSSLPNTLSYSALNFIFMVTPLLSLLAGLVPAIKACRLRPSEILRSK